MKVLVLTITSTNYGNRLQNYALNHILKSISVQPENLIITNFLEYDQSAVKKSIKKLLPIFVLKRISEKIRAYGNSLEDRKDAVFMEFTQKYMENRRIYIHTARELWKKIKDEPFVIVGSDQIWNPDFAGDDYYFANFTIPEKRMAFSASIGYLDLPEEVMEKYASYWKEMKYISVREESAADIIEDVTGKRPDVFLDPTLLLTREEWNGISQKPKCRIPNSYILCLFLGKMPENMKEQYEKAYGMECVVLNDKNFPDYFLLGPEEFLWMVQNASLILTDSFHCTVFSIIYHKNFVVFEREDATLKDMFTRMENLLSRFEFMDRIQTCGEFLCLESIEEERFLECDEIRAKERKRTTEAITEILTETDIEKKDC